VDGQRTPPKGKHSRHSQDREPSLELHLFHLLVD